MQNYVKHPFSVAALFLIANTVIDFSVFSIQTIQAHTYVVLLEAFLLCVIYRLVKDPQKQEPNKLIQRKFVCTALFVSAVSIVYKWMFSESLSAVAYVENFSNVFPFATGPTYGLKPVADASIDVIANVLYQCGFCVREDEVPLNEPFIAYLYYGISVMAGEFNHAILWLTLHAANLLTAAVLLKTAREIFPSIKYPQTISAVYVLTPGVFGVSLILFKDGFIALLLLTIFYLNTRYLFALAVLITI